MEGYFEYIDTHLVPCVSQLAIAAGDDSLWKPLIYQVCLKTRHQNPSVSLLFILNIINPCAESWSLLSG